MLLEGVPPLFRVQAVDPAPTFVQLQMLEASNEQSIVADARLMLDRIAVLVVTAPSVASATDILCARGITRRVRAKAARLCSTKVTHFALCDDAGNVAHWQSERIVPLWVLN